MSFVVCLSYHISESTVSTSRLCIFSLDRYLTVGSDDHAHDVAPRRDEDDTRAGRARTRPIRTSYASRAYPRIGLGALKGDVNLRCGIYIDARRGVLPLRGAESGYLKAAADSVQRGNSFV